MRKLVFWTIAALVAVGAALLVLRHSSNDVGNGTRGDRADPAAGSRSTSNNMRLDGNETVATTPGHGGNRQVEYRRKLAMLSRCATADALIEAARTIGSGECLGSIQLQQCIDEHSLATDRDPQLAVYRTAMSQCAGIEQMQNDFYLTLRAAAEAGDVDAQVCFLGGVLPTAEGGRELAGISDVYADYQSLAKRYLDAAFARGDWRIILRLSKQRTDMSDASLGALYPYGTPEVAYKMSRLLELGATGNYADKLRAHVKSMETDRDFDGKSILSPEQIDNGTEWARVTYDTSFARSPRLPEAPAGLCEWQTN